MKIYIQTPSLAQPRKTMIFDAETGKQLCDVARMSIVLDSRNAETYATLHHIDGRTAVAIVVDAPVADKNCPECHGRGEVELFTGRVRCKTC